MMKNSLMFLMLICIQCAVIAQDIEFEKVSKEELSKVNCDFDESASAEYLFNELEITFRYSKKHEGFLIRYNVHRRMKIYNEEGLNLAEQRISLYTGSKRKMNRDKLTKLDVFVFNIENDEISKVKLDKDDVFEEKQSKNRTWKKMAIPNVKSGSVIDMRYTVESPLIYNIDRFDIQKNYPVSLAHVRYEIPEFFSYNHNVKGAVALDVQEDIETDNISFTYRENSSNIGLNGSSRTKMRQVSQSYEKRITDYKKSNIPALVDEPFLSSIENFRSSIELELLSTKYPQSQITYYNKSWDDVVKALMKSDEFGDELKRNYKEYDDYLKSIADLEEDEKMNAVFKEVKDNYTWNDDYSVVTSNDGIREMLKTKSGNSAEINLLLVNLLSKAGLDAYPFVMRNRHSGYLNITNPSLDDLNYVIAVVQMGENIVFLDATDKNLALGMLPSRALNLKGVVVSGEKGSEIPIINSNSAIISSKYKFELDDDKVLKGTMVVKHKNYSAYSIRNQFADQAQLGEVYSGLVNAQIKDLEVDGLDVTTGEVMLKGNLVSEVEVNELEGKLFIPLTIGQAFTSNIYDEEKRILPLFYDYTFKDVMNVVLTIPEGYSIEFIPEKLSIALPDQMLSVNIVAKQVNQSIVVTIRHKRTKNLIGSEYYESIQSIYQQAMEKCEEMIVLTKT